MLSRFVIAFLQRSEHLSIPWLQSLSAVILELKKIKSVTSTFSPSICHEVMAPDVMILVFLFFFLIEGLQITALQNFAVFCQTST